MRAEIVAFMIYLEGHEYPEYAMHIFYLKYSWTPNFGNMLGNSLPVAPAQQTPELPKTFGLSTIKEYVMHISLHKVFPGMLEVIISNGMVLRTNGPCKVTKNQRKTKGQQLKGKIVSALFHTFWQFSAHFTLFQSFLEFFLHDFFLELRGFTAVLVQKE